ncbi:phosphoribosyltransferase [Microvirga lotononidis]|uniref:Putative phosphoribosyltransferase n=1 Tax=Microvirga lotononidis TaxID=864069 RepID=I4Z3T7_9HYPH|nr:phosphoribosyltransferase [Microvirga lotononidis]EIM30161.1 putative phosphoribosyltransferase [Microvirga lotononidis]EIM30879.1 putative phosphoribosyltransferase [Microvirga lotononidis]WQO31808.1 phosphoribosyltransferase [Microvirga lotononidis]
MQPDDLSFRNRAEAGRQLVPRLMAFVAENPIVLALPRGGVPVAFEIAQALQAPLDLIFVRKIGAPGHAEFGLGAVVDGAHPQVVLNEEALRHVKVPPGYIEDETERQLKEIERRREHYLAGRRPVDVEGRIAIVVDDGIATGSTVRAALKGLSRARPARLVLTVPVAPQDTLARLASEADEVICLMTPEEFYAVGEYYDDFRQISDREVMRLLDEAQRWKREDVP